MTSNIASQKQRGFTLVEVVVVVAMITLALAIVLPAIQAAREDAMKKQVAKTG